MAATTSLHRDSARPGAPPDIARVRRTTLLDRIVVVLSLANFAAVLTLLVLFCIVSEQWWLSMAMSYLPRSPYVFPSLMLAAASLLLRRRVFWLNLFAVLIVLGPIMGFRAPLSALLSSGTGDVLTVLSYNVQRGGDGNGSNERIVAEIVAANPDVIVLQEAAYDCGPIQEQFDDWHFVHTGEFFIGARWPVHMMEICRPEAFRRATAVLYEVDHPDGAILVGNVHLTTARYGLAQLRPDSPFSGRGVKAVKERQELRAAEAYETHKFMVDAGGDTPMLVVGDFNMPASGSLFQQYWSKLSSAFDAAGWGYGYTSPCNTDNLWPVNTPWLRIDHILLSSHWSPRSCWIGRTNGSDHRCIVARVQRR